MGAKNNNKSTTHINKKQLKAKPRALEVQINYSEPSIEDIDSVMYVSGEPAPGKEPITNPNITPLKIKLILLRLLT